MVIQHEFQVRKGNGVAADREGIGARGFFAEETRRRGNSLDSDMMRRRAGLTDPRFGMAARVYAPVLTLLLLAMTGIMLLCGAGDQAVKWHLIDIMIVVFCVYCLRKLQIFNLSCAPFTSFLYLCALEFVPLAVWIASATVEI